MVGLEILLSTSIEFEKNHQTGKKAVGSRRVIDAGSSESRQNRKSFPQASIPLSESRGTCGTNTYRVSHILQVMEFWA